MPETDSLPLIIEGPTPGGFFFIRDANHRVWGGDCWRGFGYPQEFSQYRDAFKALLSIKRAIESAA